jgi:transcriptional regulator with XRE-family HTH domain
MIETEKSTCLEKLGEVFREKRTEKSLNQSDVAEMVGISQAHYSMIENGKRDAEFVTIAKICKVLRVDLTAFISRFI